MAALEYERSAWSPNGVKKKSRPYKRLRQIEFPIPVLFVTEKDLAAWRYANRRMPDLVATTLERLVKAPRETVVEWSWNQVIRVGCWYYRDLERSCLELHAPLDRCVAGRMEDPKLWQVGSCPRCFARTLADFLKGEASEI